MILTDTVEFTEAQENKFRALIESIFTKEHTGDWTHFSFNGTRLNHKTLNFQCVHEIHTDQGSFWGLIDVNDKMEGIKSSIIFQDFQDLS